MNKLAQLEQVADEAWKLANADFMNDELFVAAEKASKVASDYYAQLYMKRKLFESISMHEKVCTNSCLENAGDDTGWNEGDVEYWEIALDVAEAYIRGEYD